MIAFRSSSRQTGRVHSPYDADFGGQSALRGRMDTRVEFDLVIDDADVRILTRRGLD